MSGSKAKTTQVVYTEAMRTLGRGHGFYDTESATRVRRGMCGYIDDMGLWHHIVDLTDKCALLEAEYKEPGHLSEAKDEKAAWSPMTSNGVTAMEVVLEGGADTGGGAGGKVKVEYSSSSRHSAVLLCNAPVLREGFEHESELRKWGKANAEMIYKNCPDARRFGFHVVQTTWASEDVYVNAWTGEKKGVSIAGTVRAGNVGDSTASISYRQESSAGGWVHPLPMAWAAESRGDSSDEEGGVNATSSVHEAEQYEVVVTTESGLDFDDL